MDSDTASIPDAPDQGGAAPSAQTESVFNATWQAADATLLQPNNLAISKVQRAWERRPLSPFTKQRLRVGKVWKRAASTQRPIVSDGLLELARTNPRRRARTSLSAPSKAVKKMRLDSHFDMAPRVLQWELVESPARKIVTRSAVCEEEMAALADEDDGNSMADDLDVTVEILDEDGTVLEVGGEELAQQPDWQDEIDNGNLASITSESARLQSQSTDASHDHSCGSFTAAEGVPKLAESQQVGVAVTEGIHETDSGPTEAVKMETMTPSSGMDGPEALTGSCPPSENLIINKPVLPKGFISPVKQNVAISRKSYRKAVGSRRRTLPVEFAPLPAAVVGGVIDSDTVAHLGSVRGAGFSSRENPVYDPTATRIDDILQDEPEQDQSVSSEEDWEDVEDISFPSGPQLEIRVESQLPKHDRPANTVASTASSASGNDCISTDADENVGKDGSNTSGLLLTPQRDGNLSTSPAPPVQDSNAQLPPRRSPRRKSSSPLKPSILQPFSGTSHLIALTPIRGSTRYAAPHVQPDARTPPTVGNGNPALSRSPVERATSAPPGEPKMSPQRPNKPRVSDDTALLQAFLNRAAESRGSQHGSAARRESITNRRDSDTVRQALASPGKPDVLGDLDPNSPSPRKPSSSLDNVNAFSDIELGCSSAPERSEASTDGAVTRGRDRATRRAQPQTPSVPSKISIRGNGEHTVLKRSEAQELALLTRNNTRKNKGGAVLPPLRLTKLAIQLAGPESSTNDGHADDERSGEAMKNRGVRWAETLVEFYQGADASETSILSDELNAPSQVELDQNKESGLPVTVPAASETPSKPRIRRLKPSRTASTPAKIRTDAVTPVPPRAEAADSKESTSQPAVQPQIRTGPSTRKRSRIATPAKGLTSALSLPAHTDYLPPAPPSVAQRDPKAVSKRKPGACKLPAPQSTSTAIGLGRENVILSPPKKKAAAPPAAKASAPKADLSNKTALIADDGAAPLGLASPAKKSRGRGVAVGSVPALEFDSERKNEVPGLSSPAKKRTRRAGVV